MKQASLPLSLTVKKIRKAEFLAYPCGEPFNYPQVPDVKNPENFEKSIYNRFDLL